MRILHTSDWHLGKYINNFSRLDEQEQFIDELVLIARENKIDLIIVAGDIYDTVNPPAAAEQLFYKAMRRLSAERPVFVIAGNHDNPQRLMAAEPIATELGVILIGTPKSAATKGCYQNYSIIDSGEGYTELKIGDEHAVILAMPYPSEKRLEEVLGEIHSDNEYQAGYSKRIGEIFEQLSKRYRADTVNLAVGHFYISGGEASNSERDIQLGGSYAVEPNALPSGAQYIAMGHLHRPQKIKNAYYSGSPIAYSVNESVSAKCVCIADIAAGGEAQVEKVYLRSYKPFVTIEASCVQEAVQAMNEITYACWMIVKLNVGRPLATSEIKEIRAAKADILEILNDIDFDSEYDKDTTMLFDNDISLEKQFANFYNEKRRAAPSEELIALFLELSASEDGSL